MEKSNREEERKQQEEAGEKRGDRKREERESPELSEHAGQKRKNLHPCAGWIPCQGEFSTRFSAIKPHGFSLETFARRIKATLFTARQAARFPRGEGEEGSLEEKENRFLCRG